MHHAVAPGMEIDQKWPPLRASEKREGIVEECRRAVRDISFADRPAPSDVSSIMLLHLRQEVATRFRLRPVGADSEIGGDSSMPCDVCEDFFVRVFKPLEDRSTVIALVGESAARSVR